MWCIMKRGHKEKTTTSPQSKNNELSQVEYDIPVIKKIQESISTQDNVAYGRSMARFMNN